MTPEPIDDYMRALEQELRHRGLDDSRLLAEAREHLIDAVANARGRGLAVEDAVRDAFDRFGAPGLVAAHAASQGDGPMLRLTAVLDALWQRKWWILAPTVLTALVTSVSSYYFLPTRYKSDAVISIVSTRTPGESPAAAERTRDRFEQLSRMILSRTRLERIVQDFGMYQGTAASPLIEELVQQLRDDIDITPLTSGDEVGGFNVSFVASDPRLALRVTERIASLFVEENLRNREMQVDGATQLIDSEIEDVRQRLVAYEQKLEELRTHSGGRPLSTTDRLPMEVLTERYRALLIQGEESRLARSIARRQVGEQYRVVDAARLPERPVGPSRTGVNTAGAFAGFGLGLLLVGVRGRWAGGSV